MSYQRITDPGYNTGKVHIGITAPIRPRRMNQDEMIMQSILLGRPRRKSIFERVGNFFLSFTR